MAETIVVRMAGLGAAEVEVAMRRCRSICNKFLLPRLLLMISGWRLSLFHDV
jgi:hypothetical protein